MERVITGSPRRHHDTAAPVAAHWGVDPLVDPRWDEYDADEILSCHSSSRARPHRAGAATPRVTPREFQDILESALLAWIHADDATETSESYRQFQARCVAALADASAGVPAGGASLICTSGGVLAAVCAALLSAPFEAFVAFNRIAVNAGITKVAVGRRGATLISFNEQAHLEGDGRSLVTYR